MSAATTHTYLKTRASVMSGRLISNSDLEALMQQPVEELGKAFSLTELLEQGVSEMMLNRAAEQALIHTLMSELSVLLRPLDGTSRSVLIHWARKFELYNLKALIRGKIQGLSYEQLLDNLQDLPALISLPHEKLLRTETIPELLRLLEKTPYGDIAQQARRVYEEKNEPFSLDATIDQRYYTGLLKRCRMVNDTDREPLARLIGSLIDQQNLPWLLRYRFNYELSPTKTYYLLVPSGRHLQSDRLKKMVNMESVEQVLDALPGSLKERLANTSDPIAAEQEMTAETAYQARKLLQHSDSAVTRSLAYLMLREIDLQRVYAIVQGRILDLDEALIRQAANIPPGIDSSHGGHH
ncbi:MAG: V-type ATPase subunit [Sedimenticola sp.]